jgi:hypothetical protein
MRKLVLCLCMVVLTACQSSISTSVHSSSELSGFHGLERQTLGVNESIYNQWREDGYDLWLDKQLHQTHSLPAAIQQKIDELDISRKDVLSILAHSATLKAAVDAAQADDARELARKALREYENHILQKGMRRN